jgi:hypothetical protein
LKLGNCSIVEGNTVNPEDSSQKAC